MPAKSRAYFLSPLAENDLEDIWGYTCRTWSRSQADHYHSTIIDTLNDIASGDRISRDASDIRPGYRKCTVGRHVLFYREDGDSIAVIRILHQSMDVPAQFGGEPS